MAVQLTPQLSTNSYFRDNPPRQILPSLSLTTPDVNPIQAQLQLSLELMPRPNNNGALSPLTFFVICCAFLLALFPSLFIGLIWAPYNYIFPPLPPRTPTSVVCKTPNICTAPSTMSW